MTPFEWQGGDSNNEMVDATIGFNGTVMSVDVNDPTNPFPGAIFRHGFAYAMVGIHSRTPAGRTVRVRAVNHGSRPGGSDGQGSTTCKNSLQATSRQYESKSRPVWSHHQLKAAWVGR